MVRCIPAAEPDDFDAQVRKPGRTWLRRHSRRAERPPAFWRRCNAALARAFKDRCAYTAMFLSAPGTVDHFVSIKENRRLAYDWSNYRYSVGWLNSRKQALPSTELLDPFVVRDDWFELLLPSLQLRVSARCPAKHRRRASSTIKKLGLRDDERVLRYRRKWLEEYEKEEIDLAYLARKAPQLAQAVRRWEQAHGHRWGTPSPPSTPRSTRDATPSRSRRSVRGKRT